MNKQHSENLKHALVGKLRKQRSVIQVTYLEKFAPEWALAIKNSVLPCLTEEDEALVYLSASCAFTTAIRMAVAEFQGDPVKAESAAQLGLDIVAKAVPTFFSRHRIDKWEERKRNEAR